VEQDRQAQRSSAETNAAPAEKPAEHTVRIEEIEAFVSLGRWTWDVSTGAVTCSAQLLRLYGLDSPDLMAHSSSFLHRVYPADRTRVRASIMRALNTGEPFQFQQRVVRADSAIRVLRTRGTVSKDQDGKPVRILGISQDITELHEADWRAQERLRQVTRRAMSREEVDRTQLVQHLREKVAEPLSTLGRNLTALSKDAGEPVAPHLDESLALMRNIGAATLHVMGQLRPSVLEGHGLLAALRAEALRIGRKAAIPVSVSGEEIVPRLPIGVEAAFFRLAQEALGNAALHAGCTLIRISLAGSVAQARLEIQDNGVGFDPTAVADPESKGGIALMRERAEAVSATFRLSSQPGTGTRITVDYKG
jgi:PAS domain S-box-containing protein